MKQFGSQFLNVFVIVHDFKGRTGRNCEDMLTPDGFKKWDLDLTVSQCARLPRWYLLLLNGLSAVLFTIITFFNVYYFRYS